MLKGEESMFSNKDNHDDDLMLAAEIGKSLLERNRELELLLKATQEFAEEQCAQTDFYLNQVEILRDKNDENTHTCEQLEASNQMLLDKNEQWKSEYKLLEGKNTRLWETINNLEKRVEELTSELTEANMSVAELEREREEEEERNIEIRNKKTKNLTMLKITKKYENKKSIISPCELENETLRKQISELNIQQKLRNIEKGEIESQLEDLVNENQLLYQKISNQNQEITEWENFAQKEENYRRIAIAFTSKHFAADIEPDPKIFLDKRLHETILPTSNMMKAKSCESLNPFNLKNLDVLKSPNLVNNVLSSVNSSSFLWELDTEYADLVKRYEALLEKFKNQENKNPERTRKVQRAIQTLSMDFSLLTTPMTSPRTETPASPMMKDSSASCLALNSEGDVVGEDYRKMFSEIFAKLKESRS